MRLLAPFLTSVLFAGVMLANQAQSANLRFGIAALAQASAVSHGETPQSGLPTVVIETSKGTITVELYPDKAPRTVDNFLQYVEEGHYGDTIFHRVIDGLIIQGGGFTPELEEKPTRDPIPLESDNGLQNLRGTIAMARMAENDSATAQFYINVNDNAEFDRSGTNYGYAVFGHVIEGMDVADRIAKVQTSRRGPFDDIPILPVFIDKVRLSEAASKP